MRFAAVLAVACVRALPAFASNPGQPLDCRGWPKPETKTRAGKK